MANLSYQQFYVFIKSKPYSPTLRQNSRILDDYMDEIIEMLNSGMSVNAVFTNLKSTYDELSKISYTMFDNFIKKNNLR